jgi:hypothetical protein
MTRKIRTFALAAALLAITSGSAFASSPGGTNPVPPPAQTSFLTAILSFFGL